MDNWRTIFKLRRNCLTKIAMQFWATKPLTKGSAIRDSLISSSLAAHPLLIIPVFCFRYEAPSWSNTVLQYERWRWECWRFTPLLGNAPLFFFVQLSCWFFSSHLKQHSNSFTSLVSPGWKWVVVSWRNVDWNGEVKNRGRYSRVD